MCVYVFGRLNLTGSICVCGSKKLAGSICVCMYLTGSICVCGSEKLAGSICVYVFGSLFGMVVEFDQKKKKFAGKK